MPGAGPVGEHLARLHLTHGSSELLGRVLLVLLVLLVLGTLPGTETHNSHNLTTAEVRGEFLASPRISK